MEFQITKSWFCFLGKKEILKEKHFFNSYFPYILLIEIYFIYVFILTDLYSILRTNVMVVSWVKWIIMELAKRDNLYDCSFAILTNTLSMVEIITTETLFHFTVSFQSSIYKDRYITGPYTLCVHLLLIRKSLWTQLVLWKDMYASWSYIVNVTFIIKRPFV